MTKQITPKSIVRVQWNDKWENYSKERENEIIKTIKNKYKVNSVRVEFTPTNKLNIGVTNLENDDVENINSPEVQERIILSWLKDNHVDITLDDIRRLNKRVEANLVDFNETKDNKWILKTLVIENFLSYGEETVLDFEKLKGMTLIQGTNFAGKTTIIEALIFLLFNVTTKTKKKTAVADNLINDANGAKFCKVSGELLIDGNLYRITREVIRNFKKDGTYTKTSTNLTFEIKDETGEWIKNNEEQRIATDKKIRENVGSYDEFLMTVICTGKSIFDIIEAKGTERGQLLSRFLGLEIFEKKEEVAKKLYGEWKLKSKIDKYSSSDLLVSINENNEIILINNKAIEEHQTELSTIIKLRNKLSKEKEALQGQYNKDVDANMSNVSEDHFKNKVINIEDTIKTKELESKTTQSYIKKVGEFDQKGYDGNLEQIEVLEKEKQTIDNIIKEQESKIRTWENQIKDIEGDNKVLNSELSVLRAAVIQLKSGAKCSECGQDLKDVDHTDIIASKTAEGLAKKEVLNKNLSKIDGLKALSTAETESISKNKIAISKLEEKIAEFKNSNILLMEVKQIATNNEMFQLKIDKFTVEIENLQSKKIIEQGVYEKYLQDIDKIRKNKELDELIRLKGIEVTQQDERERQKNREIATYEANNTSLLKENEENEILIDTIKKDEHINKIFLVYLNMVGKNGISKTIMKNSIPVLNVELDKFLRDSAEFTVEVEVNIKTNEVEFWMIDNISKKRKALEMGSGYEQTIAALAIRIVNSKINALPKPSLLLLDEIFSTVAVENLELIKIFMDKVVASMDNVFMITHNEMVKEWADNIITVIKTNGVSKAMF